MDKRLLDRKYIDFLKTGKMSEESQDPEDLSSILNVPDENQSFEAPESFDMNQYIPTDSTGVPPISPSETQAKIQPISPFAKSQLGQWVNEHEDLRTPKERVTDFVGSQEPYTPDANYDRTPLATAAKLKNQQQVQMGDIPEQNYSNLLGPELDSLTNHGFSGQIPMRPEEMAASTAVPDDILANADRHPLKAPEKVAKPKASETPDGNEIEKAFGMEKGSVVPQTVEDFQAKIDAARNKDSERNMLFGILKAAQMGGAGLAGSKADTSYADNELANPNKYASELEKDEKLKTANLDLMDEKNLRDPNSSASKQIRDVLASMGVKVGPDFTAKQAKDQGLNISNLITQREATKARKEDNKFKYAMLASQKEAADATKKEQQASKDAIAFDKAVDYGAKARGALGEAKSVYDRSERLNAMFSTLPQNKNGEYDFSKVDPLQKAEMVKAIDTIISGKSTIGGSQELTKASSSFKDKLAHLKQYVLGDGLVPLGQQQTVKKLYDTIQRERDITGWQLAKNAASTAKSYKNLDEADKARVIAERYGVMPEEQELLSTDKLMPGQLLNLKQKGVDAKAAIEMLKTGKSYNDIVGSKSNQLTTIDNNDVIPMISPEGKRFKIFKNKVQEALNKGFKEVR